MDTFIIKDVNEMTVDELIGQIIMIGIPYDYLDNDSIEFIKNKKIGNFILFSRNYTDSVRMKSFMKDLYQKAQEVTGSFPLVSIDQEGGMVTRLFKDVTFPASPLTSSATSYPNAPFECGRIIGKDMLSLGINLNLAPCLEINKDLSSHLVNVRSYGSNKELVLKNASEFVKGLHASNTLSCLKHFPGAGSAKKDSHLFLPEIDSSIDELQNNEMYPFLNLLESDAIMSSHCMFKSFDSVPTTLSYKLLTKFMRNKIGYKGLIISDGMEMKAIKDHYGVKSGSVQAVLAGCDILLLCHYKETQIEAFDALKEAYEKGIISLDLLKEKVTRINDAKKKCLPGLIKYFNYDMPYKSNMFEHQEMEEIVDNSYTLVSGMPIKLKRKSLILSPKVKIASIVEDEFDERNLTKQLQKEFNNEIIEFGDDLSLKDTIINRLNEFDNVIIYTYDAYDDEIQKDIVNSLLQTNKEVFVVSLKGPMDRLYFNNLKNYAVLYEYTPNSIKTVIKQLQGKIGFNGHIEF